MRAVLQRVTEASVSVDDETIAALPFGQPGLVVLLAVGDGDTSADASYLAEKTANLRIFRDDDGRFNRSLLDVGGQALVVSQFTLYGDCRHGRRPSFTDAAAPDAAAVLYEEFVQILSALGVQTQAGRFQAHMEVALVNDGPVTMILESRKTF